MSLATFHGRVATLADALLLLEGCRTGKLPMVTRRLSDAERADIAAGDVYVFDERKAGIKRWADRRLWSSSRVRGCFLVYVELPSTCGAGGFNPRRVNAGSGTANGALLRKKVLAVQTAHGHRLRMVAYSLADDDDSDTCAAAQALPNTPRTDEQLRGIVVPQGMYLTCSVGDAGSATAAAAAAAMGQQQQQQQQQPKVEHVDESEQHSSSASGSSVPPYAGARFPGASPAPDAQHLPTPGVADGTAHHHPADRSWPLARPIQPAASHAPRHHHHGHQHHAVLPPQDVSRHHVHDATYPAPPQQHPAPIPSPYSAPASPAYQLPLPPHVAPPRDAGAYAAAPGGGVPLWPVAHVPLPPVAGGPAAAAAVKPAEPVESALAPPAYYVAHDADAHRAAYDAWYAAAAAAGGADPQQHAWRAHYAAWNHYHQHQLPAHHYPAAPGAAYPPHAYHSHPASPAWPAPAATEHAHHYQHHAYASYSAALPARRTAHRHHHPDARRASAAWAARHDSAAAVYGGEWRPEEASSGERSERDRARRPASPKANEVHAPVGATPASSPLVIRGSVGADQAEHAAPGEPLTA